ncbi:ABC transporter ATP-binding protein [Paenibacillus sp. PCH8]|uniref:ATP-binding cassette domain-containing protein n=1 Tax=Paenibacillus sp. PCH8 TaxID=2066524 RepID=UPI0015E282D4|nr:ABC transporter ATP-binding protein [Paenibacillus sp. PCH8]
MTAKIEVYFMKLLKPNTITWLETPEYRNDLSILKQTIDRLPQLIDSVLSFLQNATLIIVYFLLISNYSWYYVLVLLLGGIPLVMHYMNYTKDTDIQLRGLVQERIETSNITGMLTDPGNQKDMIMFGDRNFFISKWTAVYGNILNKTVTFHKKYVNKKIIVSSIFPLIYTIIQIQLVYKLIIHEVSLGDLVAITTAIGIIESNFSTLFRPISGFKNFTIFSNNFNHFFKKYQFESKGELKVGQIEKVEIKDLDFIYPNGNKVLCNINLSLTRGDIVSFVGKNGSGKSTLAKIIAGIHDVPKGALYINMNDINNLDRTELIRKISLLNQDYSRFPLNSYENIKLSDVDEYSKQKIRKFLKDKPFLVQDISEEALNKNLGNQYFSSTQISGGQWQRIALTRSLIKESDLLIIDEGTAEIDPLSESEFLKYLINIRKDKIIIIITHNLALAAQTDRIFVFEKGNLVEEGTHNILLEMNSIYKKMWGEENGF